MSAWMVTAAHIDRLVHALGYTEIAAAEGKTPDELGRMLWAENMKSIHARYPDTQANGGRNDRYPRHGDFRGPASIEAYRYRAPSDRLHPSAMLCIIGCYDYQTCEHAGYEESDAFRLIGALSEAMEAAGGSHEDEHYRAAPWGVDDYEPVSER